MRLMTLPERVNQRDLKLPGLKALVVFYTSFCFTTRLKPRAQNLPSCFPGNSTTHLRLPDLCMLLFACHQNTRQPAQSIGRNIQAQRCAYIFKLINHIGSRYKRHIT